MADSTLTENHFLKTIQEQYEFNGLPLTPGCVEKVIFLCCRGNISRSGIIERVNSYHLKNGGVDTKADKTSMVRRALANLISRGDIQKPVVKGYYLIGEKSEQESKVILDFEEFEDNEFEQNETQGALYAYYYPSYERLARLEGKNSWPIKIGQTDGYVSNRLISQATAFPEPPVLLYSINTENPRLLESTIHGILKLRGKSCYENNEGESISSGTEWFDTNPVELQSILEFLCVEKDEWADLSTVDDPALQLDCPSLSTTK